MRLVTAALLIAATIAFPAAAAPPPPAVVTVDQAAFDRAIAEAKQAMLGDPVRARALGRAAQTAAMAWPPGTSRAVAVATAQWIEGEGAYRANDIAAAVPLTNEALAVVAKVTPGSKLNADLLLSRARLRREAGEPQNALADLQTAYKMFAHLHDERSEAKALQSIGSIYQDAQDYDRVLYYYRSAEEMAANDPGLSLSASNNMANAYLHLGKLKEARAAYQRSLEQANKLQSPLLATNILVNIAELAIESRNFKVASGAISAGMKLTANPAAANWRPRLIGARARLSLAEGRLEDARRDIEMAFALVDNATTDQSFSTLHLAAYKIYQAVGDPRRALDHLETYRRMDGEARALAASTNAALMTARFDFVNQNARIATLKAGQLRRDVVLTRLRARQSTVIFSALVALLATLLVFLFIYLRSVRRNRNEVMAANERLAQTNVDLGEALHAKSQFLATTSHEIRTPLNGILGMTQVILADRAVGGVVRDRIALVDAAGRAMRTLVDDILDFAKMDSGAVRVDAGPADLTTILPDLVSLWRVQAQDKGIDLRLTMRGVEAPLLTDAGRLRQVVFNLLSNAIKFTAHGAVTVDVFVETGADIPVVVIAVADTGVGIPAAAFDTIFEPFRQLDTSTTRQFGGTGLGLAISRHLARVLGGDITIASTLGAGSTFTVRLPYRLVAGNIAPAPPPTSTLLLIASANPIRRSFLRTALEGDFGRAAVCEAAGIAAVVAATQVGIVLVDVGDDEGPAAPDAALAGLAEMTDRPPLVLLVPQAIAAHRDAWLAAGAACVATKPLRVDALAAILHEQLADAAAAARAQPQSVAFAPDLP